LNIDETVLVCECDAAQLIELHDALCRLAELDARQSRIVELRFFAGLTEEEIAEVLGMSGRQVKRHWKVARAWLHAELSRG
jgi:RNA polymerase sigma factor (sigma-70 family)